MLFKKVGYNGYNKMVKLTKVIIGYNFSLSARPSSYALVFYEYFSKEFKFMYALKSTTECFGSKIAYIGLLISVHLCSKTFRNITVGERNIFVCTLVLLDINNTIKSTYVNQKYKSLLL